MGHGAWGIGHWALGIGHWAWVILLISLILPLDLEFEYTTMKLSILWILSGL